MLFSLQNNTLTKWKYAEGVENVELNVVQLAEQALREIVKSEGIACRDAFEYMEEKGFSRRTVERAKINIGVKSIKQGQHWVWILE